MGIEREIQEKISIRDFRVVLLVICYLLLPMPDARCPMPNAPLPIFQSSRKPGSFSRDVDRLGAGTLITCEDPEFAAELLPFLNPSSN